MHLHQHLRLRLHWRLAAFQRCLANPAFGVQADRPSGHDHCADSGTTWRDPCLCTPVSDAACTGAIGAGPPQRCLFQVKGLPARARVWDAW